jgi:CRP-like cAMP-binding protein
MLAEELVTFSPFQELQPEQASMLARLVQPVRFQAGATAFTAGQAASELFILVCGGVVLRYYPYDGGQLDLATLRPGDVFGWSAALGRARYTSTAICLSDVQALSIQGDDLHELGRTDPQFGVWLFERMAYSVATRFDGPRAQTGDLWRAVEATHRAGRGCSES